MEPADFVEQFSRTETVIREMLHLFERYQIHVSWATIGLLAFKDVNALLEHNGGIAAIPYQNQAYSPFPLNEKLLREIPDEVLFGRTEIDLIRNASGQELASHTYSHYYCLEKGQTVNDFTADTNRMSKLGDELGIEFRSIVFPRNQISPEYLNVCAESGYVAYRGNQLSPLWSAASFEDEGQVKRAKRLADAYIPVSKTISLKPDQLETNSKLINIPANRFLRPHSGKAWLEKSKTKRIMNEMSEAAENGTVYHLWWHPHNFTKRTAANLLQLETLLSHYQSLHAKSGFLSMNMAEIADHAKK